MSAMRSLLSSPLGTIWLMEVSLLKDEEKDLGLTATVIARDGIAVIVNKDNDVDELTSDQVKAVYTGETTTWEDLAK